MKAYDKRDAALHPSYGMVAPAFIHMGEAPKDALEWVASPDQRSVEDLFALGEIAGERRKLTQQIFDKKKGDAA